MIARTQLVVRGRVATVWRGGSGEPLVLLHGGWGGAETHWSRVWEPLARRFTVLAPELPGIGTPPPLTPAPAPAGGPASSREPSWDALPSPSIDAYADWVAATLDAAGVASAWCVGNSIGAAIAWQLAARLGPRCRGLILVNGPPPRPTPPWVRALDAVVPRPLLRALVRALSFSPPALARSFADRANIPAPLARAAAAPSPAHLDVLIMLLARGCLPAPRPSVPLLLLWGTADRLPDTTVAAAHALSRALPDATLTLLAAAGHCPQLEQPAAFVDALVAYCCPLRRAPRPSGGGPFAAAHDPSLRPAA